jgi:hypothetical protein
MMTEDFMLGMNDPQIRQIGQISEEEEEAHAKAPRSEGAKEEKSERHSSFASLPLGAFV